MAKFFSFSFFLLFLFSGHAQNLVPNPSFEEFENGCPVNLHEMPVGWTWWKESPNSFSTCVQPITFEDSLGWAPGTGFGYQFAASGESFVGLYTYGLPGGNNFREIVGTSLLEPLEIGSTYFISLKVNLALGGYYGTAWACNNLGVLFTSQLYDWQDNPIPIENFAHVFSNQIITDTLNWTTISGSFVPSESYTHLGIGNFLYDVNSDTLHMNMYNSLGAYYFIDDICVSKDSTCIVSNIRTTTYLDVRIFPNPCNEWLNVQINSSGILYTVAVWDIQGQRLFERQVLGETFAIDTRALEDGVYVICLSGEKAERREKLVVCHSMEKQ